jgi:type I restriction enzyme S subunit
MSTVDPASGRAGFGAGFGGRASVSASANLGAGLDGAAVEERRLSDVTEVIESAGPEGPGIEFVYIDVDSVDAAAKRVVAPRRLFVASAPAKARQRVRSGDVLVSTSRPQLNAVAAVSPPLDGAFASTAFAVLRARRDLIDDRYLYWWVQSPQFVADLTRRGTGGSNPTVTEESVRSMQVPVPSLPEQLRIAALLDEAAELRHERLAAIALLDELAESFLLDAIDDASPGILLDAVETVQFGTPGKAVSGGAVPLVRGANITAEGAVDVDDLVAVDLEPDVVATSSLQDGDVLLYRTGNSASVARAAVFRGGSTAVCAASVMRVRPRAPEGAEYLAAFLNGAHARVVLGALPSITPKNLLSMPMPMPSDDAFALFAERARQLRQARVDEKHQLDRLDELFASLQFTSFGGRL